MLYRACLIYTTSVDNIYDIIDYLEYALLKKRKTQFFVKVLLAIPIIKGRGGITYAVLRSGPDLVLTFVNLV